MGQAAGHHVLSVDEYRRVARSDGSDVAGRRSMVLTALQASRALHERQLAAGSQPMTPEQFDAFIDDIRGRSSEDDWSAGAGK